MGPQRVAWTFPKSPAVLIQALEDKKRGLVMQISDNLSAQQSWDQEIREYREKLREVGVIGWETAIPENHRDINSRHKMTEHAMVKQLDEVNLYLAAITEDQKRDKNRLYKLSPDDLKWFGLNG